MFFPTFDYYDDDAYQSRQVGRSRSVVGPRRRIKKAPNNNKEREEE